MESEKIKAAGGNQAAFKASHSSNRIRSTKRRKRRVYDYVRYERLKAILTCMPMTPDQYQFACRQAAKIAGV